MKKIQTFEWMYTLSIDPFLQVLRGKKINLPLIYNFFLSFFFFWYSSANIKNSEDYFLLNSRLAKGEKTSPWPVFFFPSGGLLWGRRRRLRGRGLARTTRGGETPSMCHRGSQDNTHHATPKPRPPCYYS